MNARQPAKKNPKISDLSNRHVSVLDLSDVYGKVP